jgi:glycerate dehydrogenase
MRAVFLDVDTLAPVDLDLARLQALPLAWQMHALTLPSETATRIQQADIVLTNKVVINADLMAQAPALKLICVAATGTNNVDLVAAKARGIQVTNVTGYGTASVVQHVFALLLALKTNLLRYQGSIKAGHWQRSDGFCLFDHPISELAGKTIGIIGYGELGQGVAQVAQAFGMQVLIAARPGSIEQQAGRVPLEQLLREADVISLHVPLAENTRNLIGTAELALMKPDAILINTARGGIVDEAALADALRDGRIGGAGIDVLTVEPPRDGNVLLDASIPNLIVTPHIAWASRESRQRLLHLICDSIEDFLAGRDVSRRLV